MAISTTIGFASVDELALDPRNPRLGRARIDAGLSQGEILTVMREWKLEELATSYLEGGGFWTQEALLVVKEAVAGKEKVVVEGNRRLAALLLLREAYDRPDQAPQSWLDIAAIAPRPPHLFDKVPYILVDDRADVDSFLGFRHVTGIKEWHPAEKAAFIAHLIDDRGLTYEEVKRRIGSKASTVRHNYIAYWMTKQIEDFVPSVTSTLVGDRFSVMYLSLRTKGVQGFLGINPLAEPSEASKPVTVTDNLAFYATWLFGTEETPPLFTDSRLTDKFGKILENPGAVEYLRRNPRPIFDVAYSLAGGDEPEITDLIHLAADNVELALARVHLYRESERIRGAVDRLARDVRQVLTVFPELGVQLVLEKN